MGFCIYIKNGDRNSVCHNESNKQISRNSNYCNRSTKR